MQYQEEQFLAREARLGRNWTTIGEEENNDEEDTQELSDPDDPDDFSIISVVEGKNPRVTERKLELSSDLKPATDVRIGTRRTLRQESEEEGSPHRQRSRSAEDPPTPSDVQPDRHLRKSLASWGHSKQSSKQEDADQALHSCVDKALEDLLQMTEELKNSHLVEDDSDHEERGQGRVHISPNGDDERKPEVARATRAVEHEGLYRANDLSATSRTSGPKKHYASQRQRPKGDDECEGTFGSLSEDLSDFEFLYTDKPTSTPASPTPMSPLASSGARPSEHRRLSRSAITQLLLE